MNTWRVFQTRVYHSQIFDLKQFARHYFSLFGLSPQSSQTSESTASLSLAERWTTTETHRQLNSVLTYSLFTDVLLYMSLCHFAKRCPLSFRLNTGISRKKIRGLAVLLGVIREPRPRPIRGLVAALFCAKTRGVGRGDFVTLIRVLYQKAVQSQIIFPVG